MNNRTPAARGERSRGRRLAGDSRGDILGAARALFASRGYRGTTTRAVAERAGVDVALIHHFFGTKMRLFAESLELARIAGRLSEQLAAPSGDVAEGVARLYLETLFTEHRDTFAGLLRTVLGSPDDVPELRRIMGEQIVGVASRSLGGPDAALRAELVAAQMIGILVLRHLVGVEPIATTSNEALVRYLVPALRTYLEHGEEA
ncbi:MAG: TetR family transcriptional regulator [Dehalococcoidia bacterium]|nr:TetR family transcriptional regulator [Dehalococcoidia bacterium]